MTSHAHASARFVLVSESDAGMKKRVKTRESNKIMPLPVDPNEFFREVTIRISSSLDVNVAVSNLHDYLKDIIPMDGMHLQYRSTDGGMYLLGQIDYSNVPLPQGFRKGDKPFVVLNDRDYARLKGEMDGLGRHIGAVHFINMPEPRLEELIRRIVRDIPDMPVPSMMHLQLDIQGQILGTLDLAMLAENVYTEEHAALLNLVKEPVSLAMANARQYLELAALKDRLADDNRAMRLDLDRLSGNQVVGADFGLRHVMEMVRQVAPINNPILLLGETGTGKEVIANAIHLASPRREKPLVRVQCGAIPDTLLDSELFGHEKGAFTGALAAKRGRFERADEGTIFLDEIGELTLEAQVKLLRVLQEKEFERLGGTRTQKVDVRVVAATHRDLEGMVAKGQFREDLWYRLNVFPIRLPPLRHRKEDIASLTLFFVQRKAREMGLSRIPSLAGHALEQLQAYDWPGNVRELQNVVERALILNPQGPLSFASLHRSERGTEGSHLPIAGPSSVGLNATARTSAHGVFTPRSLEELEREHIEATLRHCGGWVEGKRGAAALLGMNPSTLRGRMRKLGIAFGRPKGKDTD